MTLVLHCKFLHFELLFFRDWLAQIAEAPSNLDLIRCFAVKRNNTAAHAPQLKSVLLLDTSASVYACEHEALVKLTFLGGCHSRG